MGAQNPSVRESLRFKYMTHSNEITITTTAILTLSRYKELNDPVMGSFHYGSHYSNAAGVLHCLVRLEPFATLQIELQGRR